MFDTTDWKELLVFSAITLIAYFSDIRVCVFHRLFHVPCPGCGLTRSIMALLHGDVIRSITYNFLGIPIVLITVITFVLLITGKGKALRAWLQKHRAVLNVLATALMIIAWIHNLNNPYLQ